MQCGAYGHRWHGPFLRSGMPLQLSGTEERTRYISKSGTDQVTSVTLVVRSSVNSPFLRSSVTFE